MKSLKRIVSATTAVAMSVVMMGINVNAYNLHYTNTAPSSSNVLTGNSYTGGFFGYLGDVYIHSQSFSRLTGNGYLYAENVNSGNSVNISAIRKYTIHANVYLNGPMIHNYFELKNYVSSLSISASGTDSHS